MFNQPAPYSQEAEEAVIGAVLINPNAMIALSAFLKHDDFFFVRHQYIWQVLQRINERRDPIDYLVVCHELKVSNHLDEIGGPAFLTQLINTTPTSVHAEVYGRMVERAAIRRRLLVVADEIKQLAANEEMTIETVTGEAETRLFNVTDRRNQAEISTLYDVTQVVVTDIEDRMKSKTAMGLPTGFRDLDNLLSGFQKEDLIILAGRPGTGKTALALSLAANVCGLGGKPFMLTQEMSAESLTMRMLSMETGINTQTMRTGKMSPQEYSRLIESAGKISKWQMFFDDSATLSPSELRARARRLMHQEGIDIIIVDYLQLMNTGGQHKNNRVQEVSAIARALKELARELHIPVLALAQLSREVEQRADKRPVLSDLRESGEIEQSADVVMFIYRDGMYNEATEFPNQADIIVAKHRNGSTGIVPLYFEKSITKFMEGAIRRIDLGSPNGELAYQKADDGHPF